MGAQLDADDVSRVTAALSGFTIPHRWAEAEALASSDV
jgi:hypothetical protein